MSYETHHWRVYNALRRLFALALVGAGLAFLGDAAGFAARLGATDAGRPRAASSSAGLAALGFALLAVGILSCRRPTYRPDLGDVSWWAGRAGGYEPGLRRGARTWLTGDPRPGSDERAT